MKKIMIFMAAFMLFASVGAFAGNSQVNNNEIFVKAEKKSATGVKNSPILVSDLSGVFSTSCGDWSFEITCPSCSCSQLTSALISLIAAAESACLTGGTYVEICIEP